MPKASASAVDQSIPSPLLIAARRFSRKRRNGLVNVEAFRRGGDALADQPQPSKLDAGLAPTFVVGDVPRRLEACPAAVEPVGFVGRIGLAGLEFRFQPLTPVGAHLVDLALGDDAFGDELVGVDLQRCRVRADEPIHDRLGERGLVAFIVAEPPIAEHVDDHGLMELLPIFSRHLGAEDDRLRIIAVDMEDRRLDQLGDVGRIGRGTRIARIGGKADLVVDDEMQRAAGPVAAQAREAEAFGHHALSGESGVAVDQERQRLRALDDVVELILLGADLAENDRIDDLEMRRIGGQREMNAVAVEFAVRRRAKVIFDVAGAVDLIGRIRAALEFVEDDAVRLAHHLAQHVEPAAMGHAESDVFQAKLTAALDDLLERRDHRLGAVEAEALGAGILDVEEILEALGLDQLAEDRALALPRELDFLVRPFDALLNPGLLGRIGNMDEFETDRRRNTSAAGSQAFRARSHIRARARDR